MEKNISRRSFLKGTAIGAAGIAVASTGLKLQESKAEDAISDQDFWDGVFDPFEEENNCEVKVEIVGWGVYGDTFFTNPANFPSARKL